jgi:hypothetical protein
LRYVNQSVCVSSARLTRQEYGADRLFPQEQRLPASKSRGRERPEPPRERERGDRDDPPFRAATCTTDRPDRRRGEDNGKQAEEEAERAPLHACSLFLGLRQPGGACEGAVSCRVNRGVAQLVERRSPKP